MTVSDILNLILSVVAAAVAVIALWQTHRQTKLGNKQRLFDRRLEKYVAVKDLLTLYAKEREYLKRKEELDETESYYLMCLTKCECLEESYAIVSGNVSLKTVMEFDDRMAKFKKTSAEIELLWEGEFAEDIGRFVESYADLLAYLNKRDYGRIMKDNDFRDVLFGIIDDIDATYEKLLQTDAEGRMIRSMKL